MANTKRRNRRKTARIYYGQNSEGEALYWTVQVSEATGTVYLNGTLADALAGKPGVTIGCHLSKCAKRNAAAFPHDCKFAAFTKATCLVVDKIKNGRPVHAWRYQHHLGPLVDLNDKDKKKRYVKAHPEIVERQFALYRPKKDSRAGTKHGEGGNHRVRHDLGHKDSVRLMVPRGAFARAQAAGLINAEMDF